MRVKSVVLLAFVGLLAVSVAIVAPAQAGRPAPPDHPPQLQHFSTWTTGSIGVGGTVAPGRDATFDLAAVHEPNIPVECYLVVFTQKGRTTTTWVNKPMDTYTTGKHGLSLLAPLPQYCTWTNTSLSSWTYRWQITAWDDLAKEWAHVSSTAHLTVTR